MAGTIKGITVEIGGDTTKLGKAIADANKKSKDLGKELAGVNKLLKLDPKNVNLLKQKQDLLTKSIKDTEAKLKTCKEAMDKLTPEQIAEDEAGYRDLQREIVATEEKLKSLVNQQEEFGSVGAQRIAAYGEELKQTGEKVEGVGKAFLPATGAIVGLGAAAVKTQADFESSMDNVSAIAGTVSDKDLPDIVKSAKDMGLAFEEGATATETANNIMIAKAKEMGATTKFSASESADAMSYMAMAGWKTKDMIEGLDGIMMLAGASGEDLAKTSDIVTDGLTAFGMSAEEAGRFADVIAAASSNANTNVSMLGESFKYVGPVAGAMGYSLEDTSVALGLMANSGIKASSAGTSLRTLLTNMANPSDNMAAAMERLGISLDDGQGNMKSFREVMGDLREGFSGLQFDQEKYNTEFERLTTLYNNGEITEKDYSKYLTKLANETLVAGDAQKAQTAAMLAGKTGMSGLLAIVNSSDEDFAKLTGAIDNSSGAAKNMYGVMNDNLNGQIDILKSSLESLALSFGTLLMPYIQSAVQHIQAFVDKLNGMSEGQRTAVLVIAGIVAAIGPLLIGVGKVMSSIGSIMTTGPKLIKAFKNIGKAFKAVSAIFAANPIALVIIAITALVAALIYAYKHSEKFREIVNKAFNAVKTVVGSVVGALVTFFTSTIPNGLNAMITWFKNLPGKIATALSNVIGKVKSWGSSMKSTASSMMSNVASTMVSKFTALPGKFVSIGRNVINGIKSGISSAVSGLYESIKSSLSGLVDKAKSVLGIHSPSKVFEKEIGENIVKGLVKGVNNEKKNAKKSADELSSLYVTAAKSKLKTLQKANKINLAQEITYWKQVAKECKKGSKAYNEALANATKAKTDLNKKINALDKQYAKDVKSVKNDLKKSIQEVTDAYNDAVKSRKDSITSSLGLFDAVKVNEKISKEDLTANLQSQVDALKDWDKTLDKLRKKDGMDANLLKELEGMGVEDTDTLKSIAKMSDAELKEYVKLYKQKNKIAKERAKTENQALEAQSKAQIKKLIKNANSDLNKLESSYKKNLKKLGVTVSDTSKDIGKDIVKGLQKGIKSKDKEFREYLKKFFKKITNTAKDALKIKSPSRVFRDEVGKMITEGIGVGIEDGAKTPEKAIKKTTKNLLDNAEAQLRSLNMAISERRDANGDYVHYSGGTGALDGSRLMSRLDAIYERLNRLEVRFDKSTIVGEIIDPIDEGLNDLDTKIARGW